MVRTKLEILHEISREMEADYLDKDKLLELKKELRELESDTDNR